MVRATELIVMGLAVVGQATAFSAGGASASMGVVRVPPAMSLRMADTVPAAAAVKLQDSERRSAIKSLGALAASVIIRGPAFAAGKDTEDEDDG